MDQVEQSWYPGWGELPYREYNDTILPRDAPGIGFNISESILDSINEIKQLPKDLVIPNEDKSRILDEKTYQINEKTKLKIFFSDAKNDYQTGDIIFANASNSYTSFPNPKVISTAYAINLENYKTKSYIGRYCEYITNIVIELIALAKTHGFTNISFDDAFCSEVYEYAIQEVAMPIILGIEGADLEGIESINILCDKRVFSTFVDSVDRRIYEIKQGKLLQSRFVPCHDASSLIRREFPVKNARCFAVENFFSEAECKQLIKFAEVSGFDSIAWEYSPSYRNCKRVVVKNEEVSQMMWKRLVEKMKREDIEGVKPFGFGNQGIWVPKYINPSLRFTKYQEGDHFKPHRDGGFIINDDVRSVFTVIVYLNHLDFTGGDTLLFESKNAIPQPESHSIDENYENRTDKLDKSHFNVHSVSPLSGMALVFNHDLLHEASPVSSPPPSTKYILRTDIMFERIDCKDLKQYKEYQELEEYKEAERYYQISIEQQKKGNPKESTEYFIKALELQAKLSSIDERNQENPLDTQIKHNSIVPRLSYEVWIKIFLYFSSPKDLAELSTVCKYFKYIAEDNIIWRQLFFHYHPYQKQAYYKTTQKLGGSFLTNDFRDQGISFNWKIYFKNFSKAISAFQIAHFYPQYEHVYYGILEEFLAAKACNSARQEWDSTYDSRGYTDETRGCIPSEVAKVGGHYWSAGSGYKEYLVGPELSDSWFASRIETTISLFGPALPACEYLPPLPLAEENRKYMRYFHIVILRAMLSWIFNCSYPVYKPIKSHPILFAVPLSANSEINALTAMFVKDLYVPYVSLQSTALMAMYATDYDSSIVLHFDSKSVVSVIPILHLSVVKDKSFLLDLNDSNDIFILGKKLLELYSSIEERHAFHNILVCGASASSLPVDFAAQLSKEINKVALPVEIPSNSESLVADGALVFSQRLDIRSAFYTRFELFELAANPFSEIYFSSK